MRRHLMWIHWACTRPHQLDRRFWATAIDMATPPIASYACVCALFHGRFLGMWCVLRNPTYYFLVMTYSLLRDHNIPPTKAYIRVFG